MKYEWIKTSEELPPPKGYVDCEEYLIWDQALHIAFWCEGKWRRTLSTLSEIYNPTHWMEAPKKPKEIRKKTNPYYEDF